MSQAPCCIHGKEERGISCPECHPAKTVPMIFSRFSELNDTAFQLYVCLKSNNKDFMLSELQRLQNEILSSYGKPIQGGVSSSVGYAEVITPKWNGKTCG